MIFVLVKKYLFFLVIWLSLTVLWKKAGSSNQIRIGKLLDLGIQRLMQKAVFSNLSDGWCTFSWWSFSFKSRYFFFWQRSFGQLRHFKKYVIMYYKLYMKNYNRYKDSKQSNHSFVQESSHHLCRKKGAVISEFLSNEIRNINVHLFGTL